MSEDRRCRETAGFLFAHPCKNQAIAACGICAKPICLQHSRPVAAGGTVCIACFKQRPDDPDDPYLLSRSLYPDYDDYSEYDAYTKRDREAFESNEVEGEEWSSDWEADFDGT